MIFIYKTGMGRTATLPSPRQRRGCGSGAGSIFKGGGARRGPI